ncbi:MAG: hypothetical protein JWO06_1684 [Bacteroidota bacterium]|nr:hypothetical protein [Bacteroidota bacterium]
MELEMLSKYKGYKGYYRNYFFRVYAEKENTYTVNIIMYFRPNADDYGNIDYSQLYRIKSTYAPGIYSGYPCFFQAEVCCLLVQESRTWFTPFVALTRRLNWMVDIGIRENLIPLTEEEYERLLKADWELFAPPPGSLRDEKAPQVV